MPPQDLRRERQQYARDVLERYRRCRETTGQVRSADRRLALQLYDHNVPLPLVEAAILVATCRRTFRLHHAVPLTPIRSLAYLVPVIEELIDQPPDPDYLQYLRRRLDTFLADTKPTPADH